jgi:hypothetical protein
MHYPKSRAGSTFYILGAEMILWYYAVDIKDKDYDQLLRHAVHKAALQGWEFMPQYTKPSDLRGFTTTVFSKLDEKRPPCPDLGT